MDREQLQKRLEEAQQAKEQFVANANHAQGVVNDCEYWLEQLDKAEKTEKAKDK